MLIWYLKKNLISSGMTGVKLLPTAGPNDDTCKSCSYVFIILTVTILFSIRKISAFEEKLFVLLCLKARIQNCTCFTRNKT